MKKTIIIVIVLIAAVLAFTFLKDRIQVPKTTTEAGGKYDEFAKCITANGATMYGASWCGHCANTKKAFGDSFKYVNYIECADANGGQTDACKFAGITGYPTWDIKGEQTPGAVPFEELSLKTGCPLPKENSTLS